MKKILLFTLNNCGRCLTVKTLFENNNIPYTDIDITKSNNIWSQLVGQTNTTVVPSLFIADNGDEDVSEGYVLIPGKDFTTDEELLTLINNYAQITS